MIGLSSLLTVATAILCVVLAVLSLLRMRATGRTSVLVAFGTACLALAVASACYALVTNAAGATEPMLPWSLAYVSSWLSWTGGGVAIIAWLAFGASLHGYRRKWGLSVLLVLFTPLAAVIATAATATREQGVDGIGSTSHTTSALVIASAVVMLVLAGIGTYFVYTAPSASRRMRRQHRTLASAAALAMSAVAVWDFQVLTGTHISFDLMPLAFAVFAVVLGQFVFAGQFAGISRAAAGVAFESAADALIALDTELHIVALNQAATHTLPDAQVGESLRLIRPSLARHVQRCLEGHDRVVSFDVAIADAAYLGRATRSRSMLGNTVGCVVALTDVTDLRRTQRAVARLVERDAHSGTRG